MKSQAAVVMLSVHKQGFFDTISSLIEPLEFNQLCLYQLVSSEFLGFVGTLLDHMGAHFAGPGRDAKVQRYYLLAVWVKNHDVPSQSTVLY